MLNQTREEDENLSFFFLIGRETINSSYLNINFSCLYLKKVENCCLLWDLSLPESQRLLFFFFTVKVKKEDR